MTKLQIDYYNAKNQKEHWERQDTLSEASLAENVRHNKETEALNYSELNIAKWFNEERIRQGDESNLINRAHLERQDANSAIYNSMLGEHYANADALAKEQFQLELAKEYPSVIPEGNTYSVSEQPGVGGSEETLTSKTRRTDLKYRDLNNMADTTLKWGTVGQKLWGVIRYLAED